jgi:hypothetical protein
MRIVFAALALCALSFVAGIAGDLSTASSSPTARSGQSVVLLLPPDTVRAGPLPPLQEAAIEAPQAPALRAPRARTLELIAAPALIPLEKPRAIDIAFTIKDNPDLAPKGDPNAAPAIESDKVDV